jgi:helicase required for RNAi-mediated heterochromatin assembly 1
MVIVAARPVSGGLDQNPPQVDLFWGDVNDLALDPSECEYLYCRLHLSNY